MADLKELRNEIDQIDEQLVHLFEERMNVVQSVAAYKKEHHMDVLDSNREQAVIDKAVSQLHNKKYADALIQWLQLTMKLSRNSETEAVQHE